MNAIINYSDSLVASLCRETEYLKNREKCIGYSLERCLNNSLITRLKNELAILRKRKKFIFEFAKILGDNSLTENGLSINFLKEISSRDIYHKQCNN